MNNIRVDIRLRPIRFGFLVRPDDAENVLGDLPYQYMLVGRHIQSHYPCV